MNTTTDILCCGVPMEKRARPDLHTKHELYEWSCGKCGRWFVRSDKPFHYINEVHKKLHGLVSR